MEFNMQDRLSLALKVFRIELEEVENDVKSLLEYYSIKYDKREITPYVYMENRALLMKEVSCVKKLEADVANWEVPKSEDHHEVIDALKDYLKELVKERDYPKLVSLIIDRIGDRVKKYLD